MASGLFYFKIILIFVFMMNVILILMMVSMIIPIVYNDIQVDKYKKRVEYLEGKLELPTRVIVNEIPKRPTIEDVDTNHKTLKDIIVSIGLENWNSKIEQDHSISFSDSYNLEYSNQAGNIKVKIRMYLDFNDKLKVHTPSFGFIIIQTPEGVITYDSKSMDYEIDMFFVEEIINNHKSVNTNIVQNYKRTIDYINKNLKTLNRDRKLNSLI